MILVASQIHGDLEPEIAYFIQSINLFHVFHVLHKKEVAERHTLAV